MVTAEEKVKEMPDLYQMLNARTPNQKIRIMMMVKSHQQKWTNMSRDPDVHTEINCTGNKAVLRKPRIPKNERLDSKIVAIHGVKNGRKMLIVGTKKKMQAKDQRDG